MMYVVRRGIARGDRAPVSLSGYVVFRKEPFDAAGDFFAVRLERKMSSVQQMRFDIGQITGIRRSALWRENGIVFAPDDQSGRLVPPEEGLEFWVKRDVCPIVIHKVHLNIAIAGAVEANLVECPRRRVKQCEVADAILVLPACGFRLHNKIKASAVLWGGVVPIFLDGIPELEQAFFIGVAVLDDERLRPFGMP